MTRHTGQSSANRPRRKFPRPDRDIDLRRFGELAPPSAYSSLLGRGNFAERATGNPSLAPSVRPSSITPRPSTHGPIFSSVRRRSSAPVFQLGCGRTGIDGADGGSRRACRLRAHELSTRDIRTGHRVRSRRSRLRLQRLFCWCTGYTTLFHRPYTAGASRRDPRPARSIVDALRFRLRAVGDPLCLQVGQFHLAVLLDQHRHVVAAPLRPARVRTRSMDRELASRLLQTRTRTSQVIYPGLSGSWCSSYP